MKNLGKVTFRKSIAEMVANYCSAINDSSYSGELLEMFEQLQKNNILNKIYAIYPIMGNDIASLSLNAQNVDKRHLVTYANASAKENVLSFANNIGIGNVGANECNELAGEFSMYAAFKHIKKDINGATLQNFTSENNEGKASIIRQSQELLVLWGGQAVNLNINTSTIGRVALSNVGESKTASIVKDGVLLQTISSDLATGIVPNLNIGVSNTSVGEVGQQIEANSALFSGELYFYALGVMTADELVTFDTIVSQFLSKVKSL